MAIVSTRIIKSNPSCFYADGEDPPRPPSLAAMIIESETALKSFIDALGTSTGFDFVL